MKKIFLFSTVILLLTTCQQEKDPDPEFTYFTSLLEGKFSSSKQASEDQGYSSVVLHNIPIWKNRAGYWLYHELHSANDPTTIYLQRILNIRRIDTTTFGSRNYKILNQKKYANGWKDHTVFDHLEVDSLQLREGCELFYIKKTSSIYFGKTEIGTCLSNFKKEMLYTTSKVVISKDRITSWEKGFDTKGKQIWGKIQEPYQYDRFINE